MSYIQEILVQTKQKNPDQPQFLQTVEEVLGSIAPAVEQNEQTILPMQAGAHPLTKPQTKTDIAWYATAAPTSRRPKALITAHLLTMSL